MRSAVVVAVVLVVAVPAIAQTYYVDASDGSNGATGDSPASAWQTFVNINGQSFASGTEILLERGESWGETLSVDSAGLLVSAYGAGSAPVVYGIDIFADDVVIDGVDIDHQRASGRALRIRSGHDVVLRNMEIANGIQNGVDVDDANGLLIESCHIHHFLAGSFAAQDDAHGITATTTLGMTIRDTEVHHVSGDSFQSDPDRNGSTGIVIEGCHFWTSPLAQDFNAGWVTGDRPGENAIDTKVADANWDLVTRMTITVRDTVAHGWEADSFIANKAAFNMKEKITAVFDGVTVYDNEIAFRLRGSRGNADVTLINAVVYANDTAIRAEDDLANLEILNSTFGSDNTETLDHAGGSGGVGTWDVRNNAFWGAKPAEASAASNIVADTGDFVGAGGHHYDVPFDSDLVDAGETIGAVTRDRVGRPRSSPYDVGAYEYVAGVDDGAAPMDGAAPTDGGPTGDSAVAIGDPCAGDCDATPASLAGGCGCGASPTAAWLALLGLVCGRKNNARRARQGDLRR